MCTTMYTTDMSSCMMSVQWLTTRENVVYSQAAAGPCNK